jgi:GT2 family glycosyltransferase
VSIVIVGFNSLIDLRECIPSLLRQGRVRQQIIVVDNASRDDTAGIISKQWPEVVTIRSEENRGFAWACNRGAAAARGDVLVFLNPDTVVGSDWLHPLVEALDDDLVGACMPRILLYGSPCVNTLGSRVHWSGLGWMDQWQQPDPGPGTPSEVFAASGCALAVRADTFRAVGGFAEDFFMYQEDVDLCWRLRLRGYRVVVVPRSSIQHKYSFGRNDLKWHMAERNRLKMVLANYRWTTLLLLTPALLAIEIALVLYAARAGLLAAKWAAARDIVQQLPLVLARRRSVQRTRRVGDTCIWRQLSGTRALWQATNKYAAAVAGNAQGAISAASGGQEIK